MNTIQIHANSDVIAMIAMSSDPESFVIADSHAEEQHYAGTYNNFPVYVDTSLPFVEEDDGTLKTEITLVKAGERINLKFDRKPSGLYLMERYKTISDWLMKEVSKIQ